MTVATAKNIRNQKSSRGAGDLAGIEYCGIAGASLDCQSSVERLLQFGDKISLASILSAQKSHCLLLTTEIGDLIAIKSGFASGYGGEGPRRFSYVLQLLDSFDVEIQEFDVDEAFLARIDFCLLTMADLESLKSRPPVRPSRWHNYISSDDYERARNGSLLHELPPVMPYSIIDQRIMDLAISFWPNPDNALFRAYRRLEDIVRERTGLREHSGKLFSKVFGGDNPVLKWRGIEEAEKIGRVSLFTGTYMAHRNPRAHGELETSTDKQLSEFLVLNHLFKLEALAG